MLPFSHMKPTILNMWYVNIDMGMFWSYLLWVLTNILKHRQSVRIRYMIDRLNPTYAPNHIDQQKSPFISQEWFKSPHTTN